MDETVFLAHIAEDGREQTVDEHERGTAELCAKFAAQFGAEEHAKLEAMRHDDGKNTQGFQRRLRGGPAVDHSTAGAYECFRVNAVHEAVCIAGITADYRTWVMLKWTCRRTARFSAE